MKSPSSYKEYRAWLIDGKDLPETFQGYPTSELVDMMATRGTHQSLKGNSREKIGAMDDLSRIYKMMSAHRV